MNPFIRAIAAGWLLLALLRGGTAGALEIVGPASGKLGEPVTLELTGLPSIDLEKPFGENLKWSTTLKVAASMPTTDAGKIRQTLSIDFAAQKWLMVVSFTPSKSGTYVVAATLNGELVQHRVDVGGKPEPEPDPPGPGPEPQPTPGPKTVVILYETADASPAFARMKVELRKDQIAKQLTDKKTTLLILDDDQATAWKAKIGTATLPVLIIADSAGTVLSVSACPTDSAGVVEALKKAGAL